MNFQEINAILKKHYSEKQQSNEDDDDYDSNVAEFAYTDDDQEIPGIGKMTEIAQKGGEGEGEEWYSVKYFPEHDVYIRIEGSYASYDGTNFYDWDSAVKEVRPREKTITVYE